MSRTSCSPALDRDPIQEELLSHPLELWPLGWGSLAVPPFPAQARFLGWPRYHHTARLALGPVPAQSKSGHGGEGIGTAYGKGITTLPKPGCCLQPDQPSSLPTCFPPVILRPHKDWCLAPAAEFNSFPCAPGRARLLQQNQDVPG